MKSLIALLALTINSSFAVAQGPSPIDLPQLLPGDSWSYQITDVRTKAVVGKYTTEVLAKGEKGYAVRNTSEGYPGNLPQGISLTLGRLTNVQGQESDYEWLNFPLTVGKSWRAKELWHNSFGSDGYEEIPYTVDAVEEITVPAGTFEAVRVKGYGQWTNTTKGTGGQAEITYWYSPDVKWFVRFDRKNWFRGNVMDDWSTELTAFKVTSSGESVK